MALQAPRGIVTPEAVVLDFETAGVGSRTIARIIDLAAQAVALYLVVIAVALGSITSVPDLVAVIAVAAAVLGVVLGYPILFETLWNGRTPGKAALGLRVVTVEGAPIRFRHAALRAIVGLADLLFPPGGATAIVTALLTRRTQRLGDLAAGTIVLRERSVTRTPAAVTFRPFPGWEQYTSSLDVAALSAEEYGIIRSFLVRVGELEPAARGALAARLAPPVAAKLRHDVPATVHPEHFLLSVAAAYQARFGGPVPAAPVVPGPASGAFEPTFVPAPARPSAPPPPPGVAPVAERAPAAALAPAWAPTEPDLAGDGGFRPPE